MNRHHFLESPASPYSVSIPSRTDPAMNAQLECTYCNWDCWENPLTFSCAKITSFSIVQNFQHCKAALNTGHILRKRETSGEWTATIKKANWISQHEDVEQASQSASWLPPATHTVLGLQLYYLSTECWANLFTECDITLLPGYHLSWQVLFKKPGALWCPDAGPTAMPSQRWCVHFKTKPKAKTAVRTVVLEELLVYVN